MNAFNLRVKVKLERKDDRKILLSVAGKMPEKVAAKPAKIIETIQPSQGFNGLVGNCKNARPPGVLE